MSEMKKKSEYLVEVNNLKQYFPIKTGFMKTTPLKAVDGVSFNITFPKSKIIFFIISINIPFLIFLFMQHSIL